MRGKGMPISWPPQRRATAAAALCLLERSSGQVEGVDEGVAERGIRDREREPAPLIDHDLESVHGEQGDRSGKGMGVRIAETSTSKRNE